MTQPIFICCGAPQTPGEFATLKAAAATPGLAGALISVSAAEAALNSFTAPEAILAELPPSLALHWGLSAMLPLAAVPVAHLDGVQYPRAWTPKYLAAYEAALNNFMLWQTGSGLLARMEGMRICDSVVAPGDMEWGYQPDLKSGRADYNWSMNEWRPTAVAQACAAIVAIQAKWLIGKALTFAPFVPTECLRVQDDGSIAPDSAGGQFTASVAQAAKNAAPSSNLEIVFTSMQAGPIPGWYETAKKVVGVPIGVQLHSTCAGMNVPACLENARRSGASRIELHVDQVSALTQAAAQP